jgi:hypothetical protein
LRYVTELPKAPTELGPFAIQGDNMLDVVRQLAVLLSKLAILTTIIRATTDEVARGDIHG